MAMVCIKVSEHCKTYIDKRKKEGKFATRDSALVQIIAEAEAYREIVKSKKG